MEAATAIAEREAAGVPALAYDPATEITAADVALPKLKIGQSMTEHVQDEKVPNGGIFTELSADDPDPVVLAKNKDPEKGIMDPGPVVFYVLDFFKAKSSSQDGELSTFAFTDPNAPEDAWVTYNYVVAVPDHETDVPFKFLLTRTGTPAAKQLNLMLQKAAAVGPPHTVPFELATKRRQNDKGKWFVAQIKQAAEPRTAAERKARGAHAAVVENLRAIVVPRPGISATLVDEPEL